MRKLLNQIPIAALGIAGYSQIDSLRKHVEELENKIRFFIIFFSINVVVLWLIIISEISQMTS